MSRVLHAPTFLLVEDNPAMRALIRSLIEPGSASVHECADGASAVALYEQLRPDWVLMDIRMGRMDGIVATRAIRQADPAARIIIITEHRDADSRRAAAAAGAAGFLLKENLVDLPALLADLSAQLPEPEEPR